METFLREKINVMYSFSYLFMFMFYSSSRLDSVSAFRAEIVKKSALSMFNQAEVKGESSNIQMLKGQTNVPQPFFREKLSQRRRNARYMTLPITIQVFVNFILVVTGLVSN